MAKDVDLTSREWNDIVFDGKNKEFGAYKMRAESDKRHNKAMFWVLLVLAIIIPVLVYFMHRNAVEAKRAAELAAQEQLEMFKTEDVPVEEEVQEEEQVIEVPEEKQAVQEDILNTEMLTELVIKKDDEVKSEVKSQDEMKDETKAIGAVTFDKGTDDVNVTREFKNEVIVKEVHEPVKEKVFQSVEQMPSFPGGEAQLMKFLRDNIKYPVMAQENGVQGRVIVRFVVSKTGKIGEVQVLRAVDRDLDKEAIRVIKSMPAWQPGKQNGEPVNVWFTLPVSFKLQ